MPEARGPQVHQVLRRRLVHHPLVPGPSERDLDVLAVKLVSAHQQHLSALILERLVPPQQTHNSCGRWLLGGSCDHLRH